MHKNSNPFTDLFKLNQHALHSWLLRAGSFFIFVGLIVLLLNIQSGLDRGLVITGLSLSILGIVRWFALQKPHWNWIAITFFSLSGVIGVFICLVLVGVLLPMPVVEPAAIAAVQTTVKPSVDNMPTDAPLIDNTPTAVPSPTPTAVPTKVPTIAPTKKTTKSSAQPTETTAPTVEPTAEVVLEQPTVTVEPTLIVVIGPTVTPTPEVIKTRYLHFVQPDENLTCIAINYLGSDRYLPQICQFNQEFGLMGDDCGEYLAPGRRVVIPTSLVPGYEAIPEASLPPHNPNACLTADEKSE